MHKLKMNNTLTVRNVYLDFTNKTFIGTDAISCRVEADLNVGSTHVVNPLKINAHMQVPDHILAPMLEWLEINTGLLISKDTNSNQ